MQSHDEIAYRLLRAPLVVRALVEPPVQGVEIDVEDEDLIEQVDELREVARAATEEGDALAMVGDQGLHAAHVPDVVFVRCLPRGLTSSRIALMGQFSVTVNGVVTAPFNSSQTEVLPVPETPSTK